MRGFAILCLSLTVTTLSALPQNSDSVSFGGSSSSSSSSSSSESKDKSTTKDVEVNERLGLLASDLNKHPTGGDNNPSSNSNNNNNNNNNNDKGKFQSQKQRTNDYCCCTRRSSCPRPEFDYYDDDDDYRDDDDYYYEDDYEGINPRSDGKNKDDIVTRIVNNGGTGSGSGDGANGNTCSAGSRRCCYNSKTYRDSLSGTCTTSFNEPWQQRCGTETLSSNNRYSKTCGERDFDHARGLRRGEASPEEFPWTCLILADPGNIFIGTCAIVPDGSDNSLRGGTRKVITAAHKLDAIKEDQYVQRGDSYFPTSSNSGRVKIRVLEYDANAFNSPEKERHIEYTVTKFTKHPRFKPGRLSNDIAVMTVDRDIDLDHTGVNAACVPRCREMFDFKYQNGTGTRCWVAGWGKDSINGNFRTVMHKVDVPIYDDDKCETALKNELSDTNPGLARRFRLDDSEICAGGELGKDACDGDGGAPLVCQAKNRKWYVVGLVAWGVDCALQNVPGVYVRVSHFRNFIANN